MLKNLLLIFKKGPIGFIKRALYKILVGSKKYGNGNDYDAARYWHDRYSKYGLSLRGAGVEGLSEDDNEKIYAEAGRTFTDLCLREGIDFQNVNVLEIGCGSGWHCQLLHNLGVKSYLGIDIADVLLPKLRKKFTRFEFARKDITSDRIEGRFDLIVMIDVIQHIVNKDKFSSAMENVLNCLADNGIFVVSPIMSVSKKLLFYERAWSFEDIQQRFPGCIFSDLVPFRNNHLLVIRKPQD